MCRDTYEIENSFARRRSTFDGVNESRASGGELIAAFPAGSVIAAKFHDGDVRAPGERAAEGSLIGRTCRVKHRVRRRSEPWVDRGCALKRHT